jgi:hypothetical protein
MRLYIMYYDELDVGDSIRPPSPFVCLKLRWAELFRA